MANLDDKVFKFIALYGPARETHRKAFIADLRSLLEEYGHNAIKHGDLPDTEHPHKRGRPKKVKRV